MSERPRSRTEQAITDDEVRNKIERAIAACATLGCRLPYTSARPACPQYAELAPEIRASAPLDPDTAHDNARRILPIVTSCQIGRSAISAQKLTFAS